jgi:hypothetical protein
MRRTVMKGRERLDAIRRKAIERTLANMPKRYHRRYLMAVEKRSRPSAVSSKCFECMGHDNLCTRMVARCPSLSCPLWCYRPGSNDKNDRLAIRQYVANGGQE